MPLRGAGWKVKALAGRGLSPGLLLLGSFLRAYVPCSVPVVLAVYQSQMDGPCLPF